ncbi:MAG: redoxin domain-containing protein [Arcticibacter sp.]
MKREIYIVYSLIVSVAMLAGNLYAQNRQLQVHLEGVFSAKVSLMPMVGAKAFKPLYESPEVKPGETLKISIPADQLPGQFVLRCDYQEREGSTPYPAERNIIIHEQDLEMWLRPKAINNPDSTFFQKGEIENAWLARFMQNNTKRREQLGLLQSFLMNYDRPESAFFKEGAAEYEGRRRSYNTWIAAQTQQDKNAFISNIYGFELLPALSWQGSAGQRMESLLEHYFDHIDLSNPLLIRVPQLRTWTDQYVNIYGTRATSPAIRDSLFTLAGKRAIEKARTGHPLVYGWMVDYFYKGYEGFNISSGIQMLEPYLADPRCLTSKRLEIEKRLKGIESIRPGAIAPDFQITDQSGKTSRLHDYKKGAAYKLLLFWSADCQHCLELVQKLYPWYLETGRKNRMEVLAVSLDFTDVEVAKWNDARLKMDEWKHIHARGGINSEEASAYYVLATPVMILIDPATSKILALPETIEQLNRALKLK